MDLAELHCVWHSKQLLSQVTICLSGRRELSVELFYLSGPDMDELQTPEKTEILLYEIFFLLLE